jgi:Tol biopolymer transport system component
MVVKQRLIIMVCCLLVGGCSWTDSGNDERSEAHPVAQRIVYSRSLGNGDLGVWIARLDGGGKRLLAKGHAPVISPDGRWVAFQGRRGGAFESGPYRDLMLVSASGGRPRLLVRAVDRPVWSPDSKRVAAVRHFDDRRRALLSIEIETGKSTTVARGAIDDVGFSRRGDELVFTRGAVFGSVDIYVADADGRRERRVTDDGESAYPVWGPREIAFARIVPYRGWGAHEIWLVRPDGGGRRLLTKTPRSLLGQGIVGLVSVAWSSDGRALLAALANEFGGIPYAVDPQTGAVRRIGNYGYHAWPDGLSRDGQLVLVSETGEGVPDRSRIEVVPYAGGAGHVVARASEASWNR